MQTNLDSLFLTDDSETTGVWLLLKPEVGFLVKRLGGKNEVAVKSAMAKHYKPKSRLIENDLLAPEEQREILIKMFVDSCLIDWKGVEFEGEVKPFDKTLAVKLLVRMPELFNTLYAHAQDLNNFKAQVGNS